eukprot:740384-Prorocentrum_lima.AAC.1
MWDEAGHHIQQVDPASGGVHAGRSRMVSWQQRARIRGGVMLGSVNRSCGGAGAGEMFLVLEGGACWNLEGGAEFRRKAGEGRGCV